MSLNSLNDAVDGSSTLNGRLLEVLKEAVGRSTSARSLSERLGHAHNYVRRVLSGEIPLQMETLQLILRHLGMPPELFFEQVFQSRPAADPVAVLRFYREGDGLPRDPFLDEIGPRIETLLERTIDRHADVESWSEELEQLEERRFEDREGAKEALEALARAILDRCEQFADDVPSRHVADLAGACSIWAVIQRISGYRDNSCDMYQLVFRCAHRAENHFGTVAKCYQRASYLLRDLDAMRAGLFFLRVAGDHYLRAGDVGGLGEVLVDRGKLLFNLGDPATAEREFRSSLKILQPGALRHRATAHAALARILDGDDRLTEAMLEIRRACDLYSERADIVSAQVKVLRGRIAGKLGLHDEAERSFVEAFGIYEQSGHPGYILFAGLEYAGLLLTAGRTTRLAKLADQMFSIGRFFRKNRLIDSALMEFVRMAKWGELTEELLEQTRRRLEATSSSIGF